MSVDIKKLKPGMMVRSLKNISGLRTIGSIHKIHAIRSDSFQYSYSNSGFSVTDDLNSCEYIFDKRYNLPDWF